MAIADLYAIKTVKAKKKETTTLARNVTRERVRTRSFTSRAKPVSPFFRSAFLTLLSN